MIRDIVVVAYPGPPLAVNVPFSGFHCSFNPDMLSVASRMMDNNMLYFSVINSFVDFFWAEGKFTANVYYFATFGGILQLFEMVWAAHCWAHFMRHFAVAIPAFCTFWGIIEHAERLISGSANSRIASFFFKPDSFPAITPKIEAIAVSGSRLPSIAIIVIATNATNVKINIGDLIEFIIYPPPL